jgi:hypothetical protein
VWGLLWDRGNLAIIGQYGVGKEAVDAMFALGEWVALPHGTRAGQLHLVGPAALPNGDRVIDCVVEVRDTPVVPRFRPIVARWASRAQIARWERRHRSRQEQP